MAKWQSECGDPGLAESTQHFVSWVGRREQSPRELSEGSPSQSAKAYFLRNKNQVALNESLCPSEEVGSEKGPWLMSPDTWNQTH